MPGEVGRPARESNLDNGLPAASIRMEGVRDFACLGQAARPGAWPVRAMRGGHDGRRTNGVRSAHGGRHRRPPQLAMGGPAS